MMDTDADNDGVIIQFPGNRTADADSIGLPRQVVEMRREPGRKACARCLRMEVDGHYRTLVCRDCGKVHDPFEWLVRVSKWETSVFGATHALNQDIRRKEDALEELKRVEANARTRVKRLQDRLRELEGQVADVVSAAQAKEQIALFLGRG
jgi:uncharacterized coiled-coil protein SlyX